MPVVLVVDDLDLVRMLCRRYLEAAGYQVIEAANGAEAVKAYQEQRPDAVLMDMLMPEMDGLTALRLIRGADPAARVAMFTAEHDRSHVVSALQSGALDYVVKPFRKERLVEAVERLLGQPRA